MCMCLSTTYPSTTCYHMSNLNVAAQPARLLGGLWTRRVPYIFLYKNRIASACACAFASTSTSASTLCSCLYMTYLFITCPSSRLMPNSINLSDCHLRIGNRHCDTLFSLVLYALTSRCIWFSHDSWCRTPIYLNVSCHRTHRSYSILSVRLLMKTKFPQGFCAIAKVKHGKFDAHVSSCARKLDVSICD